MSPHDSDQAAAGRVQRALDLCRDAGVMGGFHSPDADRCVLCGYAKFHKDQFRDTNCGRGGTEGRHLLLSEVTNALRTARAEEAEHWADRLEAMAEATFSEDTTEHRMIRAILSDWATHGPRTRAQQLRGTG